MDSRNTLLFDSITKTEKKTPRQILEEVYNALDERGYNAIDQIFIYY